MTLSIVLGLGLIGGAVPSGEWEESIIFPENVDKSEFVVFVKIENQTFSTTDAKIVTAPIDKIRLKQIDKCNSYGAILETQYEIILAD